MLAGLVLIALVVLAIPAGRRMLRARLSPMLGQVLPRLLEVAQQPGKLAQGIGGTLLLSLSTSSASPPAWRRSAGRCRSRKSAWYT